MTTHQALAYLQTWRYADITWSRVTMLWTVSLQNGMHVASAHTLEEAVDELTRPSGPGAAGAQLQAP